MLAGPLDSSSSPRGRRAWPRSTASTSTSTTTPGFAAACRQGRDLGFDGKTLIHPRTIAAANLAFTPGDEEVALARRIIQAHAEAEAAGRGVVVVDGRLVESLHVAEAHRVVALAAAIAARRG